MSMETALLATLVLPLVGMVLIWLTGNAPNLREGVTIVAAIALFAIVLALLDAVMAGASPELACWRLCRALRLPSKSSRWVCCSPASHPASGSSVAIPLATWG